jgi:hypothetical protein
LEAELTGCILTFRRETDLKSMQTLAAVITSGVDSPLNISVFVLYVFLRINNAALTLDSYSDNFSLGRSRWKSDLVALQNKQTKLVLDVTKDTTCSFGM